MSANTPSPGPAFVRFGRRTTRGLLLGLSTPRCASIGSAVTVAVVGLVIDGGAGLIVSAIVWAPLLASVFVTSQGSPLVEWAPVVGDG